jgi:hypothetical protein
MKLQIIETENYILAVSDEKIVYPEPYFVSNSLGDRIETAETKPSGVVKKIIAYQPKGNAPELDLPLLPEMVVEDAFIKYVNTLKTQSFKGWSEEAENGYLTALSSLEEFYKANNLIVEDDINKQVKTTPKWFVAEYKTEYTDDGLDYQSDELKTITIKGKTYLLGKYLNE